MKKARLILSALLVALSVSACSDLPTAPECWVDPGGNNRCE